MKKLFLFAILVLFFFNINFVNAGIDGQSTIGHIWNFNNWFNKIENFKSQYILFYF